MKAALCYELTPLKVEDVVSSFLSRRTAGGVTTAQSVGRCFCDNMRMTMGSRRSGTQYAFETFCSEPWRTGDAFTHACAAGVPHTPLNVQSCASPRRCDGGHRR
jgi:hypothetical protein